MGLAGSLARDSSKVYFNEKEARRMNSQHDNRDYYWQKIIDVYVANGFAAEGARTSMESHPAHKYGLKRKIDLPLLKMVT